VDEKDIESTDFFKVLRSKELANVSLRAENDNVLGNVIASCDFSRSTLAALLATREGGPSTAGCIDSMCSRVKHLRISCYLHS